RDGSAVVTVPASEDHAPEPETLSQARTTGLAVAWLALHRSPYVICRWSAASSDTRRSRGLIVNYAAGARSIAYTQARNPRHSTSFSRCSPVFSATRREARFAGVMIEISRDRPSRSKP